jgi:hypothetical protein
MKRRITIIVMTLSLLLGFALLSHWRAPRAAAQTQSITFTRIVNSFTDPANPDYPYDPYTNSFTEAFAPSLDGDDLAFIVSAGGQNQRVLTTVVGGVRRTVAEDATGRTTWPNLPSGWDPRFWKPTGNLDQPNTTQISFENGKVAFLLDGIIGYYGHYGVLIGDASQPPASRLKLLAGHQSVGGPYEFFYREPLDPLEDLHVELDQGKVVFLASLGTDAGGVFRVAMDGSTETLLGPQQSVPLEFGAGSGRMAYTGAGLSGIHVRDGSGADVIAVPGGIGTHFSLDGGDLAFFGAVGGSTDRIFKYVGGTLFTVAGWDISPLEGASYGAVSLDNGKVAFATKTVAQEQYDDVTAIYTDFNGSLEKVIKVGDFITGGGTVTKLYFSREGLSGNKLAFGAKFANGRAAIYVATLDAPVSNTPPTISGASLARQQGAAGAASTIANVGDAEDAPGSLSVTVTSVPAGISVSGLTNTGGVITANVAAACDATLGDNLVGLQVTDSGGLAATANLTVNVTANPAPALGDYPNATVTVGGGATITPTSAPADNGSISSVTATAPGFTGTLAVNAATGVVMVSGAGPAGGFLVTVNATDNCGAMTTKTFTLTISSSGCSTITLPALPAAGAAGSPYAGSLVGTTPVGTYNFTVSAGALPPGVTLNNIFKVVSGTPTAAGTYNFTITARRNNTTCEGSRSYTVTIIATVAPILECVQRNQNGTYTARFGYHNSTGAAVTIPVGANNYFTPGAQNRGQTTLFQPGRVTNAFSVTFAAGSGSNLAIWHLRGPDGVLRPVNVLTTSIGCP